MILETVAEIVTLMALLGLPVGLIGSFYYLIKRRYGQMMLFASIGVAMMAPLGIFLLPVILTMKPAGVSAKRVDVQAPSPLVINCVYGGKTHCKDI